MLVYYLLHCIGKLFGVLRRPVRAINYDPDTDDADDNHLSFRVF